VQIPLEEPAVCLWTPTLRKTFNDRWSHGVDKLLTVKVLQNSTQQKPHGSPTHRNNIGRRAGLKPRPHVGIRTIPGDEVEACNACWGIQGVYARLDIFNPELRRVLKNLQQTVCLGALYFRKWIKGIFPLPA
jgi:hypothetical protein